MGEYSNTYIDHSGQAHYGTILYKQALSVCVCVCVCVDSSLTIACRWMLLGSMPHAMIETMHKYNTVSLFIMYG